MSNNEEPARSASPSGGGAQAGPPPPRPLTAGNVLRSTVKLTGANVGAGALLTVALMLLQVLLSWVWTSTLQTTADSPFTGHWLFFLTLAVAVGMPLVNGTLSRVAAATLLGRSRRLGPALRASVGRYPALLAVAVVQLPVVWISAWLVGYRALGPGTLLWVTAPAVVLATLCLFSIPAVMLERLGPVAGIRRSYRLVAARFWRVLGTIILVLLLALAAVLTVNVLLRLLNAVVSVAVDAPVGELTLNLLLLNLLIYTLTWGVLLVVPAVAATVMYLDARHRAEGLTLDQLEAQLEGGEGRTHG